MKTQKKKRTTSLRYWAIALVVILVLVTGGLVAANFNSIKNLVFPADDSSKETDSPAKKNQVDYNTPSDPQTDAGNDIKKDSIDKSESEDDDSSTSAFTTNLTVSENDGIAYVRSDIDKISSQGTCTLTITKDSSVITKTAGIQALPQTSTCKGFDIDIDKEGMTSGTWVFKLTVTIGESSSVVTKSLEL